MGPNFRVRDAYHVRGTSRHARAADAFGACPRDANEGVGPRRRRGICLSLFFMLKTTLHIIKQTF